MGRRLISVILPFFLLIGCSAPEEEAEVRPQSSESVSEVTPVERALTVYQDMWALLVDEAGKSEPDYSDLQIYASGDALELVRHGVVAEEDDGVVARGEPSFSPEVVAQEEDRVEIEDCMDSTNWLREDEETGDLVEPSPDDPIQRKIEAAVIHDGLSWTVHELRIWDSGTCDG